MFITDCLLYPKTENNYLNFYLIKNINEYLFVNYYNRLPTEIHKVLKYSKNQYNDIILWFEYTTINYLTLINSKDNNLLLKTCTHCYKTLYIPRFLLNTKYRYLLEDSYIHCTCENIAYGKIKYCNNCEELNIISLKSPFNSCNKYINKISDATYCNEGYIHLLFTILNHLEYSDETINVTYLISKYYTSQFCEELLTPLNTYLHLIQTNNYDIEYKKYIIIIKRSLTNYYNKDILILNYFWYFNIEVNNTINTKYSPHTILIYCITKILLKHLTHKIFTKLKKFTSFFRIKTIHHLMVNQILVHLVRNYNPDF